MTREWSRALFKTGKYPKRTVTGISDPEVKETSPDLEVSETPLQNESPDSPRGRPSMANLSISQLSPSTESVYPSPVSTEGILEDSRCEETSKGLAEPSDSAPIGDANPVNTPFKSSGEKVS